MIPNLPSYVSVTFGLTTLATLLLVYRTLKKSHSQPVRKWAPIILAGLIVWLLVQAVLSLNGVYSTPSAPPKIILLGILPAMIVIIGLMITPAGRLFTNSLPLVNLTYLNVVRVPVELVLLWLFWHKAVPELMTFEGRNPDILSGITAPLVAYFGLKMGKWSRLLLLAWNLIGLVLLLNIVVTALLSAPTPFQRFAFDQPNVAISYFPFSWLPTFIVPIVLFGHLVSIRQLIKRPVS